MNTAYSSDKLSHGPTGSTSSTPSPAITRRRITPWYEGFVHQTYRAHWIGAPWRDTTPYLRGEFAHYALKLEGEVVAVTLDLGAEIERKALAKADGAKRYLTERIDHHLEAEFGRKVEFWFRLEAGKGPHNLPFSFREPTSGRVQPSSTRGSRMQRYRAEQAAASIAKGRRQIGIPRRPLSGPHRCKS